MRTLLLIVALLAFGRPTARARPDRRRFRADRFFVDDLHLDFRDTGRIRNLFKRIASALVEDGDRFAIVSSA